MLSVKAEGLKKTEGGLHDEKKRLFFLASYKAYIHPQDSRNRSIERTKTDFYLVHSSLRH